MNLGEVAMTFACVGCKEAWYSMDGMVAYKGKAVLE